MLPLITTTRYGGGSVAMSRGGRLLTEGHDMCDCTLTSPDGNLSYATSYCTGCRTDWFSYFAAR